MAQQSAILNVMTAAAIKAGKSVLRDFGELDKLQVSRKSIANFATNADNRAEQILHRELSKARPEYSFMMEESGEVQGTDPTQRFVIDPIDGTNNFIHAVPFFCVAVAYEKQLRNGKFETHAGVIYDPIHNELFTAELYQGALMNGQRISVSGRNEIDTCIIATYLPARDEHAVRIHSGLIANYCSWRSTGSTALDLAYVAAGRFDALCLTAWKHWDVAAGKLLVREAGGKIKESDDQEKSLLIASNPSIHTRLLGTIATPMHAKPAKAAN